MATDCSVGPDRLPVVAHAEFKKISQQESKLLLMASLIENGPKVYQYGGWNASGRPLKGIYWRSDTGVERLLQGVAPAGPGPSDVSSSIGRRVYALYGHRTGHRIHGAGKFGKQPVAIRFAV